MQEYLGQLCSHKSTPYMEELSETAHNQISQSPWETQEVLLMIHVVSGKHTQSGCHYMPPVPIPCVGLFACRGSKGDLYFLPRPV